LRIYTAHLHPNRRPVLVREGFSWGALVFGPLWLARHGAWIATAIAVAALVLACTVAAPPLRPLLAFGVFLFLGALGNDIRRWSLGLGRFQLAHVVAARSREEALHRLLTNRADLRRRLA
jgi:hypothetical protein